MSHEKYDITAAQCRAARALLGWSQGELASESGVGVSTIRTFEPGRTMPIRANLAALRTTLETAGVEFIPENGGGPGVRLRK
ncbi:MAG: helix-turn-helix domain-containing protein [Parvibaculaceae bacterium]